MVVQLGNDCTWFFNVITVERKTMQSLLSIQKAYAPSFRRPWWRYVE